MDPYDISILLKALDGQWETIGAEAIRYRGVWPENVTYSHNDWGDDTCSFELRRDPGAIHPDLSAFTDCEIHVAGRLAWAGRVRETPTREGPDPVISVQGEGWQYHLDDDQYSRIYAHSRLSEWRDVRSHLDANLAVYTSGWQVQTGDGGISFGIEGTGGVSFPRAGVYLDLGSAGAAKRVVIDWEKNVWATGNFAFIVVGDSFSDLNGLASANIISLASATSSGTTPITVSHRYVALCCDTNTAQNADRYFRATGIRVFTDTVYESGNQSILRADQIVTDALNKATLLLDPDRSGIEQAAFGEIPEFATSQMVSPREAWQAANAYENYETKIDARRPIFRPRASSPIYEMGEWSGAEFEDASANSGAEILNRVFVEGQTAGGERLVITRYAGQGINAALEVPSTPVPTNPSMVSDTSGWSLFSGVGTLSRDTAVFDSSPASLKIDGGVIGGVVRATFSGTFLRGRTYVLTFRARRPVGSPYSIDWRFGALGVDEPVDYDVSPGSGTAYDGPFGYYTGSPPEGSFTTFTAVWTPQADRTGVLLEINNLLAILNIDSLQLAQSVATLVDRRRFLRARTLPIRNRITQASAGRLGDLYLQDHRTTPFTGGFKAVGVGGVRRVLGGQSVHPGWLGRDTGQMVRANHVIDPDTGGVGRDERIKAVQYDHNTLTATVSLAEDRGGFDALLERLAVVVG